MGTQNLAAAHDITILPEIIFEKTNEWYEKRESV